MSTKETVYISDSSAVRTRAQVNFLEAFVYVFESRDRAANLAIIFALCIAAATVQFVGMFFVLIMIGYQFAIIEGLSNEPEYTYRRFDINQLADYLHRGIWVFLLTLPLSFAYCFQVMFYYFGFFVTIFAVASSIDNDIAAARFAIGFPIFLLASYALSILFAGLLIPIMLRLSLTRKLSAVMHFRWAIGFFKKTWLETILISTVFMSVGGVLQFVGMLSLCIGTFFAHAWLFFAMTHFMFQLYAIYLHRGGEPIEIFVPPPKLPAHEANPYLNAPPEPTSQDGATDSESETDAIVNPNSVNDGAVDNGPVDDGPVNDSAATTPDHSNAAPNDTTNQPDLAVENRATHEDSADKDEPQ